MEKPQSGRKSTGSDFHNVKMYRESRNPRSGSGN